MQETAEPVIYTIGHSNHPVEWFIGLLRRHAIAVLVDVRSSPYSRHNPQYNRETLAASLTAAGIDYAYRGDVLGGRPLDESCYLDDGRVDYEAVAEREFFRAGLARVRDEASLHPLALMCAEKDPGHCHRTLLVSRNLARLGGLDIRHILADGTLEQHSEVHRRIFGGLMPS
ncbi:MAG: DUF488 domain-containing protein [Gammaproteobacteria bacterium AqS3]|nr:DUF488 domain-containing protein [Gammaproteobacteria bacterium AqS3]